MDSKKTTSADLEDKRGIFFQVGLVIALLIAVLAINYESPKPKAVEVTVKVTGLEIRNASDVDSSKMIRPPEISR